jgi:hypothetical protein
MELSRRDPDTDDYVVLVETPIAPPAEGVMIWHGFGRSADPGYVAVGISSGPPGRPPEDYEVDLEAAELGELLAYLPPKAVAVAIDRWLASAEPDAVGAAVGRIVAHLAKGTSKAAGRADQAE